MRGSAAPVPLKLLNALVVLVFCIVLNAPAHSYSLITRTDDTAPNHSIRKSTPDAAEPINNRFYYSKVAGDTLACGMVSTSSAQPANLTESFIKDEIIAAMHPWNNVSNSQWQFYTTSVGSADGRTHSCLETGTNAFHDIYWYTEEGTTLATTWFGLFSGYQDGAQDIGFNTTHAWSSSSAAEVGKFNFRTVLIHEFGHVLGLHHSTVNSATMWPSMSSGVAEHTLHDDDISGAQYLYGSGLLLQSQPIPASMNLDQAYDIGFTARFDGGAITPSATELYLVISVVGDADVSIQEANPQWTSVSLISIGQPLYDIKQDQSVTASHKGVEAYVSSPTVFVDYDWDFTVQITPRSGSNVRLRWRTTYLDPTTTHTAANGGSSTWNGWGDLVPRYLDIGTEFDQQGFPANYVVIPVNATDDNNTMFVPIQPCRILDTRNAVGAFTGDGETRSLYVFDSEGEISSQGGLDGGCGIPTTATAIQINFSAVNPSGFGYLRAWASGRPEPTATLMAWTGGVSISNSLALAICPGLDCPEFEVKVYAAGTHLVGDITGYYVPVSQ